MKKFEKNYRISPKEVEESENKANIPSIRKDDFYQQNRSW